MAQGALANMAVSLKGPAYDGTNVAQLSKTISGPVLAKISGLVRFGMFREKLKATAK